MTFSLKEDGKHFLGITIAAFIFAFNLKTFVQTGGLYPGGVTGITVLAIRAVKQFAGIELPYTLVNMALNAFPVYIGFRFVGKKMTLGSLYLIALSSFLTDLLPSIPITYDTLLIAIFGGMINGFAVGLCLLMNANSGGTDFIAMYLSEKLGYDTFNFVLGLNAVILSVAGIMFGWDKALYSILFQYFSTQVLHLVYRRYQQTTLFIVTNLPLEVCNAISEVSRHGATIMQGHGAYSDEERAVVYSVVSSSDYRAVLKAVKETDPKAFFNSIRTEQLSGRFYRKPTE